MAGNSIGWPLETRHSPPPPPPSCQYSMPRLSPSKFQVGGRSRSIDAHPRSTPPCLVDRRSGCQRHRILLWREALTGPLAPCTPRFVGVVTPPDPAPQTQFPPHPVPFVALSHIGCGGEHPPNFTVKGKTSCAARSASAWEGRQGAEAAPASSGTVPLLPPDNAFPHHLRTSNVDHFLPPEHYLEVPTGTFTEPEWGRTVRFQGQPLEPLCQPVNPWANQ